MKNILMALIVVDMVIVIALFLFGGEDWLVNSQVAFLSSSLVMLASIRSYKSMVDRRLNVKAIPDDERDILEKLEDPYDLYDEKKKEHEEEKALAEVVKEERANLKKSRRSIVQTTKDARASFSFYRLGAYAFLVLGFFYLNSNHLLKIMPYLIFLSVPSLIIVVIFMKNIEKNS